MTAHSRLPLEGLGAAIERMLLPVHFVATAGHSRGPVRLYRAAPCAVSAIARAGVLSILQSIHLSPLNHLQKSMYCCFVQYKESGNKVNGCITVFAKISASSFQLKISHRLNPDCVQVWQHKS